MKKLYLLILSIAMVSGSRAETATTITILSGKITNTNGEGLIGVSLYFPDLKTGAITNIDGFYRIDNLPVKTLQIQVSMLGYRTLMEKINLTTTKAKDFILNESITEINEVTVTGQTTASKISRTPTPMSVLNLTEMQHNTSTNIIDAISSQPGVSQITTGSGISKPVIRGLGYNRVVVVNDGIRQEGQQWGDEHGIEIDENDVYKVEIMKGPASLLFGSDAMAGVISFISAPILPQNTMRLTAMANYQTNNGLMAYSVDFAGHKKTFIWDFRYSNKQAHDYQNSRDGYVFNSGFREDAVSALLGISNWWGYSHLTLNSYHLTPGIVEGERDSLTGQFIKPILTTNGIASDALLATQNDFVSYQHKMPYQQVHHYKAVWNNNFFVGDGSLNATIGYQQNRRQEFAEIETPNEYGLYFQLHTLNYDFHYQIPEMKGYNLTFGINGMYQNSLNKGSEFLVPEYNLFDVGGFLMAKKNFDKLDVSGGIRFDHRKQNGVALYLNALDEKATAEDPSATERFAAFSDKFNGISGSMGATYQINEIWNTKLNLSRGFRAPNISELGSNGVHEGSFRYEIGNTELKPENSLQIDYELGYNVEHISAKLNLFANNISNFIYSHKLNAINGGDSIQSDFPCFKFDSGNAQLLGGELYIDIHPHPWDWLHFENSFSYVHSVLLNQPDSTHFLPFTPPTKWISNMRIDLRRNGNYLKNTYFFVGLEHHFKQKNIYYAFNTETVTDAYTLINGGIGTDVVLKKQTLFSLYLSGTNLADIAYQSHLSRLKYAPKNYATSETGVYNMGRNISLKLIVPVNL